MFTLIHLATTNDTNGNPRRAWFEINDFGRATSVWLEGYAGSAVLPKRVQNARLCCPTINVQPKEFKSWIKSVDPTNQID